MAKTKPMTKAEDEKQDRLLVKKEVRKLSHKGFKGGK